MEVNLFFLNLSHLLSVKLSINSCMINYNNIFSMSFLFIVRNNHNGNEIY